MNRNALVASLCLFIAPVIAQIPPPAKAPTTATPPVAVPASASIAAGEHKLDGVAAFYNNRLNGRRTASGQIFDNSALTAAHNTLAFGTKVKVTNVKNNKSVVVRINDRGPTTPGRIFDLSRAAAAKLGYLRSGTAEVKGEIVAQAPAKKAGSRK